MDILPVQELEEASSKVLSEIKNNNLSEAEKISIHCAKSFPKHADSHYLIGKVFEAQANPTQALNAYSNAIQLDSHHKKTIDALNLLFCNLPKLERRYTAIISRLLNSMQDLHYGAQYIALGIRVLEEFGYNENLLLYMGEVYERLHDYQEAMDCYSRIIEETPKTITARIRMAAIFFLHDQFNEALQYSKAAIDLGSASFQAKFLYTLLAGDEQVLSDFTSTFLNNPDNPHINFYMNFYRSMADRYSINLLMRTVTEQHDYSTLLDLMQSYLGSIVKTTDDSQQKFKNFYKLNPKSFDTAQLLIGQSSLLAGNMQMALTSFEHIREYFPESPVAELGIAAERLFANDNDNFEEHRNKSVIHKLNAEMSLSDPISQDCESTNEALASVSLARSNNYMLRDFFSRIVTHHPIETYFEITSGAGSLLYLNTNPNINCRYVSSRNIEIVNQYTNSKYYITHPNNFFGENDLNQVFDGKKIDIAYISFKNNLHQILANIIDTSKHMSARGIMCIANVYPFDPVSSSPIRRTPFWIGETWKVIMAIKKHCPELKIRTYKVHPGGLSILSNFTPETERSLRASYPEMISEFENMNYSDIYLNKDELLSVQLQPESFFNN